MKIDEILKNKRTLSFEVFPPKKYDEEIDKLYSTIRELKTFSPDFISVTYGAGGTNRKSNAEIAGYIKSLGIEPLAHLTGGPSSYDDIDSVVSDLKSKNVENILALRGDKPLDFNDDYCKRDLDEFIEITLKRIKKWAQYGDSPIKDAFRAAIETGVIQI